MRGPLILALLAASVQAVVLPAASAEILEQVVALVDEQPIFSSELRDRARQKGIEQLDAGSTLNLYRKLLDEMIDEVLISRKAEQLGIRISDKEIQQGIEDIAAQNGLDKATLIREVEKHGLTQSEFEADVHTQLVEARLIAVLAPEAFFVEESGIRRVWEMRVREFKPQVWYRVSAIWFYCPADASSADQEAVLSRAHQRARELRSGALSFERVLREERGYFAQTFSAADIEEALRAILDQLKPGEIADPVKIGDEFAVYQLDERRYSEPLTFEEQREAIRQELAFEKMKQERDRLMERLRDEACIIRRLAKY